MSPPERPQNKTGGRGIFSALGLAAGASPASFSPLMPSPSMLAKIRDISSPRRSQMRGRWSPPSLMSGLAMDNTPSLAASQAALPTSNEEGPSGVNVTVTPAPERPQSPDEDALVDSSRKRKQGVMFTEPTTPANKKKKKNPKTPFPDPDLDSSEEDEDEDAPADNEAGDDPYMIATQAPAGSSWDGLSTPEFEDDPEAPSTLFLQDLDGTGEAHIEEVDEEQEVASQLGNVSKGIV